MGFHLHVPASLGQRPPVGHSLGKVHVPAARVGHRGLSEPESLRQSRQLGVGPVRWAALGRVPWTLVAALGWGEVSRTGVLKR